MPTRGSTGGSSTPGIMTRPISRDVLAEDAVFHSPVVHRPQEGKAKVYMYLDAAGHVFADSGFRYTRIVAEGNEAVLEFAADMDGIHLNGVDMIRWNDDGRIVDFKVMVRPLKAVNHIWQKMGERLAAEQ